MSDNRCSAIATVYKVSEKKKKIKVKYYINFYKSKNFDATLVSSFFFSFIII